MITAATLLAVVAAATAAADAPQRIHFRIQTVDPSGAEPTVISDAIVDGPPGIDFEVCLDAERFRLAARFLTDLVAPDRLRIRSRLETHRLYGYSERELPLYEEDRQRQTLDLGFDEALVLLPFGGAPGDDTLRIEIVPQASTGDARQPLRIDLLETGPGGVVRVTASRVPHHFVVRAAVIVDDHTVLAGTGPVLLEERGTIELRPTAGGPGRGPLRLDLTVEEYRRGRPVDRVSVRLDLTAPDSAGPPLAQAFAGIGELGSRLDYALPALPGGGDDRPARLQLTVDLAPGEAAD